MIGAAAIVIFGVVFTATRLNLERFDNELRFRGQAHRDLSEVLSDPKVKAGLRCGPLTGPNHKIVPDARWIADLRDGRVQTRAESYRDDRDVPLPDKGVAIVVTSRFAIFKHAWTDASRRRAHPGPARRLRAREDDEVLRRVCQLLGGSPWPLGLAGLFLAALILRLAGLKTGLPYVYNADENSHFVPRAIGMFGHSLNPDYFINPPAFTYVLHGVFTLRWGTDPATIGGAFAADPTTAFTLARAASALLGALAVSLTAIAGARLFDDRRVGLLAGALLAVAFLPVHYSHFALNDAPTLAPLAAALIGVAGIYRTGRTREYVLAGLGLGVAIATKYTAGIVLVTVIAAAFASPVAHARIRNLALAIALMCAGFLAANPYALLDHHAFREGLEKQTETAGEDGGKLGLANTSGWRYYLGSFTWGLGWLPSLFAVGGAVGAARAPPPARAAARARAAAAVPLPRQPVALLRALDAPDLPDPLPAGGVGRGGRRGLARRPLQAAPGDPGRRARDSAARPGARVQRPQRRRAGARRHAHGGPALDGREHPGGLEDRRRADRARPVGGRRRPAAVLGHRQRQPLEQVAHVALVREQRRHADHERRVPRGQARGLRAHDAPGSWSTPIARAGSAGSSPARPSSAARTPTRTWCRTRCRYYDELRKRADVVYRISPYGRDSERVPFSFDYSFNYYPLTYERPGPEIVVYRLRDCEP